MKRTIIVLLLSLAISFILSSCNQTESASSDPDLTTSVPEVSGVQSEERLDKYIEIPAPVNNLQRTAQGMIDDNWEKQIDEQNTSITNYVTQSIPLEDTGYTFDMMYSDCEGDSGLRSHLAVVYRDNDDSVIAICMCTFFDSASEAREFYERYKNAASEDIESLGKVLILYGSSIIDFSPMNQNTSVDRVTIDKLFEHFCRMMNIVLD